MQRMTNFESCSLMNRPPVVSFEGEVGFLRHNLHKKIYLHIYIGSPSG